VTCCGFCLGATRLDLAGRAMIGPLCETVPTDVGNGGAKSRGRGRGRGRGRSITAVLNVQGTTFPRHAMSACHSCRPPPLPNAR
jgi:hypothetical protein